MASKYYSKPHNGPYASPRGNAVMAAKRTTGEGANTILRRHVILEKCSTPGCDEAPIVTTIQNGMSSGRTRKCWQHLSSSEMKGKQWTWTG